MLTIKERIDAAKILTDPSVQKFIDDVINIDNRRDLHEIQDRMYDKVYDLRSMKHTDNTPLAITLSDICSLRERELKIIKRPNK